MQPTIFLDAGHGGFDNGATYNGRAEKDDTLRLTLLVGQQLEQDGYNVQYTRTTDIYHKPTEKAQIANEGGADYFVSIHRNASPSANQYSGVETLVYQDSGIPAQMARAVNAQLEELGFRNLGVSVRPELAVLRRTRMPAILIEAGFLNTDSDNALFDEKLQDIAKAIARGIVSVVDEKNESETKVYGVQVGLYRRYENARYQQNRLMENGYNAQIRKWKDYFAVVVGRETTLLAARQLETALQNQGFDTLIVTIE